MANWQLPTLSSLYADFLTYISNRLNDVALMFDSATTSATNIPTGTKRWNSTANRFEKWNGTAWVTLAATHAISISGNAATATTATTVSNNAISSAKIASSAVTTTKIADGNVTTEKLADGGATSAKIADNSVTASKIVSGAVTEEKLAGDFVLDVAKGGTGAVDAPGARSNLGAQATLVSGTNIKTINGGSLLGSGDIVLPSSLVVDAGGIGGYLVSQSDPAASYGGTWQARGTITFISTWYLWHRVA